MYEKPEVIEIGVAEDVIFGSKKLIDDDQNGTGFNLSCVDEDCD